MLTTLAPHAIGRSLLLACLMQTMIERADPLTWERFLAAHELDGDISVRVMGAMLLYARGHLWLAAGKPRAALADFEALWRRDELSGQHTPALSSLVPQALAHLQLGDRAAAHARAPRRSNKHANGTLRRDSPTPCGQRDSSRAELKASGCCARRLRPSRIRPRAMSTPSRRPSWAPRSVAPAIAATHARRCAKASTSPTAAARRGWSAAPATNSSPPAHAHAASRFADATRSPRANFASPSSPPKASATAKSLKRCSSLPALSRVTSPTHT